jgi:RNA polymerase sigma-70 factor (ECF subfamily)
VVVIWEWVVMAVQVRAVRGRDAAWFDALYRSCYREVLQYARRRVPAAEADDVVAEVFTTAWRRRTEFVEIDRAWLLRTAGNHILHVFRSAGRRARLQHKLADLDAGAWDGSLGEMVDDPNLDAAMRGLSPADRELLRLSAWEQLETSELASVLRCTTAAARVRLYRARRRLAALLAEQQPHSTGSRSEVN